MTKQQIEELEVVISANADGFRKELADVNKRLNSVGATTQRFGKTMGGSFFGSMLKANLASQILIGTVRKIGNVFGSVSKQVIGLGSQYTRLRIATDTVARNMGMTAGEVQNLRDQLEDANTYGSQAENTIKSLALSGLMDMAKGLKAVDARSGETTEGVNALVLAMKDLGAAAGIDSADAIERVTSFVRRGNVALADGLIEIGNLYDEYRRFAATLGKTSQQLSQEEKAQARLNIVMREAEKVWGAYANTMQTSGKAMASIRDATTSIFERFGNYMEPIFASVTRAVFEFVKSIREALIGNAEAFRSWANKVAAYVVAVVRILGSLLTRIPIIGKYFQNLTSFALKPVVSTMDKLNESATGGASGMDTATESAKKLKKELLGLAGFDEMNVLKQDEAGGTSAGGTGVGVGGFDVGELIKTEQLNESIDEINAMADEIEGNLRKKLKELAKALEPVWDFLEPIVNFLKDNWKVILLVVGGITLLVGIVKKAIGVFKIFQGAVKVITTVVTAISGFFAAGGMFDTIALYVMYAVEAVKGALIAIASALGISVGWVIVIIAALIAITILLVKNWDWVKETAKKVWNWLVESVFRPVGEFFTKVFNKMVETVKDWFNKIKEFFDKIKKEVFEPIKNEIERIINGLIIPILHNFMLVMGMIWDWLVEKTKEAWEWIKDKIIKPVVDWINKYIVPIIKAVVNGVVVAFNWARDGISSAWSWIKDKIIKPVVDWIGKYITPVIDKVAEGMKTAWEGVKSFFSTIWEGIKSIFKGGVNWIIDKINWFIGKVNWAISLYNKSVGQIPGSMPISYTFSKIPRLAQGGVIDDPTLAMLGESGKEVVMPLENNTGWIDELARKIGNGNGNMNLVVKIGDDKIFEKTIDYINDKGMRSGVNLLNI
jgi:phage-related protein